MRSVVCILLFLALAILPLQAQDGLLAGFDPDYFDIDGNVVYPDVPGMDDPCNPPASNGGSCTDWKFKLDTGDLPGHIADKWGRYDENILSPGSRVKPGSTLAKEDITNVYMSNNLEYLYLAEERRANNGNSSWHLILTQALPRIDSAGNLVFDLAPGDMDIQICFPTGSDPTARNMVIRTAKITAANVEAAHIWDNIPATFDEQVWTGQFPFELNTTNVPALVPYAVDSKGNPATEYEPACFAEAAIPLWMLGITGQNVCDYKAYATVITRSSCSTTSDVKDLAGPVLYKFGGPDVTMTKDISTCGSQGCVTAKIIGGTPPYKIQWYDNDVPIGSPQQVPAGSNQGTLCRKGDDSWPTGTHTVKAVVTDRSESLLCAAHGEITFSVAPSVSALLTAPTINCQSGCAKITVSGGTPPYTIKWTDAANGSSHQHSEVVSPPTASYQGALCHDPLAPEAPWEVGDHTFSVEVTDANNCVTKPAAAVFTIYGKPKISLSTPHIACNKSGCITATITQYAPPAETPAIRWYDNNVEIVGMAGKTEYCGDKTDSDMPIWSVGSHNIKVTFSDSVGCYAEASTGPFEVYPELTVSWDSVKDECGVVTLTAKAEGGSGISKFLWSLDNGPYLESAESTFVFTPTQLDQVQCKSHTICVKAKDTRNGACETEPICKTFDLAITTTVK